MLPEIINSATIRTDDDPPLLIVALLTTDSDIHTCRRHGYQIIPLISADTPPGSGMFTSWAQSSRQRLEVLQRQGKALSQARSPRQMMALGALQAHLAMALQAHAASSRRAEDR